ncbi:helix-turn-helix domain-containing protein [Klebsiella aerogenes]|nr:helix-turn-helix transcriptional regulator [Klebsiella aerogenes]
MTQSELAKPVGIGVNTLSNLESGKVPVLRISFV